MNGKTVVVDSGDGKKEVTPKARALTIQSGEVVFIAGATDTAIDVNDMRKVLNRSGKIELTKALNADEQNKKRHLKVKIV